MNIQLKAKKYTPHGSYGENIAIMHKEDLISIKNKPLRYTENRYIFIDNNKESINRRNLCAKVIELSDEVEIQLNKGEILLEETTMFDYLLLNKDDNIFAERLLINEVADADEIKIEIINPNEINSWSENNINEAKNRFFSSDNVLSTHNIFWLFCSDYKPTLSRIVETTPTGEYVKCTEKTKILIVNLPKFFENKKVGFNDIGGLNEQIKKIREMVQLPIQYPEIFSKLGVEPPKGIILFGPPGTGKTLLAKAVANEIQANFQSIRGPEILTKWAGEAERKLRDIFETARQNSPSIIFFDEIDSIAPLRDDAEGMITIRLVSQILDLMDGLISRGKVIVIAATNRINSIDPALRRPGRFDREIEISVPNQMEREEILKIYIKKMNIEKDLNLKKLISITAGYTGADIASLCKEAGIKALRRLFDFTDKGELIQKKDNISITNIDFFEAYKEIIPSTLRTVDSEKIDVSINDLLGLDSIKEKIYNHFENSFIQKRKMCSNFIINGNPGTGKTMLINAFATKYNLRIISISAFNILQDSYTGIEKVLNNAFTKTIQSSPALLVIDHLDAMFDDNMNLSKTERFIIDKIIQENKRIKIIKNIIVIATTYDKERIPHLLRGPQCFSEIIDIPSFTIKEREVIINNNFKSIEELDKTSYKNIIEKTDQMSYSGIIQYCQDYLLNY